MKYTILTLFTLLTYSVSAQLEITFKGVKEIKGSVFIGIYNDSDVWLEEGKEFKPIIQKVSAKEVVVIVDKMPAGTYAISSFHDINDSGDMDKSFVGIPQEPYGFSNNVRPSFRAANWEESKFEYDGTSKKIVIELE